MQDNHITFIKSALDIVLSGTADRLEKDGISVSMEADGSIRIDLGRNDHDFRKYFSKLRSFLLDDEIEAPADEVTKDTSVTSKQEKVLFCGKHIQRVLKRHDIEARVLGTYRGSRVTRFEVILGDKNKVSDIEELESEFMRESGASSVRVEAAVAKEYDCVIEFSNDRLAEIDAMPIIESDAFKNADDLVVTFGRDYRGEPLLCDLAKTPNLFIAGYDGKAKGDCIDSIMQSLLSKIDTCNVRMLLIDPNKYDLVMYCGIPKLLAPIVIDTKKALRALYWVEKETMERANLLESSNANNIDELNAIAIQNGEKPIPHVVVVIPEIASLMRSIGRHETEFLISKIADRAVNVGIHLIMGTRDPMSCLTSNLVMNNIASKVVFKVDYCESSSLNVTGAQNLLGKGDLLYIPNNSSEAIRGQVSAVKEGKVEEVVKANQSFGADYDDEVIRFINGK